VSLVLLEDEAEEVEVRRLLNISFFLILEAMDEFLDRPGERSLLFLLFWPVAVVAVDCSSAKRL
jgi:hypothetical protein